MSEDKMTNKTKVTDDAFEKWTGSTEGITSISLVRTCDRSERWLSEIVWQAASQHYERETSLDNKSASELLEMSAAPFDKACLMVRDMEREIAELKAELADVTQVAMKVEPMIYEAEKQQKQITELSAHINRLREASINFQSHWAQKESWRFTPREHDLHIKLNQAISATPAQSLAEHDNETIERCAELTNKLYALGRADEIELAIRALKS